MSTRVWYTFVSLKLQCSYRSLKDPVKMKICIQSVWDGGLTDIFLMFPTYSKLLEISSNFEKQGFMLQLSGVMTFR